MKKKLKRALSVFLATTMLAGYSPVTTLAADPGVANEMESNSEPGSVATESAISVAGANLTYGYDSGSISVSATPPNDHIITGYQWYDNGTTNSNEGGTIIDNATESSYSIQTGKSAGTYYYYCVVSMECIDNGQTTTETSEAVEVTINKEDLTVTANDKTITYGDNPENAGVSYSGFKNSDDASSLIGSLSYSYSYSQYDDVGYYTITPSGLSSENYEINYVDGTLTVDQKPVGISWGTNCFTYDGQPHAPEATATELVNGDLVEVVVTGAQTDAGTDYTATASDLIGTKAGNYSLPIDNTNTFSISRQAVTPVFDPEHPETNNVAFIPSSVPNGITPTVSMTDQAGNPISENEYDVFVNTKTHKVIISDALEDAGNYDIATATFVYPNEIGVAVVRTAPVAATLTYNGTEQQLLEAGNYGTVEHGTLAYALGTSATQAPDGEYTTDPTAIVGTNAGDYYIWFKAVGDQVNYNDSIPTCIKVKIAKKTLTATANPISITYGEAPTNAGVTYDGFEGDDSADDGESVNTENLAYQYTYSLGGNVNATGDATSRDYAIILSGLTSENYAIQYVNGVLTVNKKEVAINVTASDKVYDGTASAEFEASLAGEGAVVPGDDLRISNGTAVFSNINVGTDIEVTFSGFGLAGSSASNYVVSTVTSSDTADITVKDITVAGITAKDKIYDGTNVADFDYSGVSLDGIVEGEHLNLTATGTFEDVDVEEDVEVTITGVTLQDGTNGLADNYHLVSYNTLSSADITKRPITVTADSDSKMYDGTALTNNGYTAGYTGDADKDALGTGDQFDSVTVSGSQIGYGSSANVPSGAVIKNSAEEDVTSNYDISYANGTLSVTKKPLTITADSASKSYDGTALTKNTYTSNGLAEGDSITSVTMTGSQTAIGSSDNVPSEAVIKNSAEEDVTANYEITYVNGTLEVTNKTVTITAGDASKVYDGTALTSDSYTNTELFDGDWIESVTVTGSQTAYGSSENVPSGAVIKNTLGEDVTASYDINYVNGTLSVEKKTITITADSASKVYDGTALTKNTYISSDLAEGDSIVSVTITGSQTAAGSSDNVPSEAVIKNSAEEDVTDNYEITYVNGMLEVKLKTITITADSDSKVYDGTALTKDSYTSTELYEGDRIESVTVTGSQTTYGSSANVPSGAVIKNSLDEDVTALYDIVYANGTLTVEKRSVTITADSDTKVYDGTALAKNTYTSNGLAIGDRITSVTISGSRTVAGTSNNVPSAAVINNSSNEDVTSCYDITYTNGSLTITKKALTITADDATKVYDGTALTKKTYTSSGLVSGERITSVTFSGSQKLAGTADNVPSGAVIKNSANKNVTSSYDITYEEGTLTVTPKAMTITAKSASKVYDGTALTESGYTSSGLAAGDRVVSVTVTGSQTNVGLGTNIPSNAVIKNASNEDVTASYGITYKNGTLTIEKSALTITAGSATKVYDGTALTSNSFTSTGLLAGDRIVSVTTTGSRTIAGTSANVPSGAVILNNTNADVTNNYAITYVNGSLEVTKKSITITADNATKIYDGTALTNSGYTSAGLASGDSVSKVTIKGSRMAVGTSNNVPSGAVIKNSAGKTVTSSYVITYVNGNLKVTKKALTIKADNATKTYDGTALTKSSFTSTGLVTGDSIISVKTSGSQTIVGTSSNAPSGAVIKNSAGGNVTSNYEITYESGTLEVTKRPLAIKADSAKKTYDGTALLKDSFTANGLATGDCVASAKLNGRQIRVGISENVASAAVVKNSKGVDVTSNYEITYESGTLEVTKRPLTIKADSAEKVYDGTALTCNTYTNTVLAAGDRILAVTINGSLAEVGTSTNVPSDVVIVNSVSENVTFNYDVTYINGTLQIIGKAAIETAPAAATLKHTGKAQKLLATTGRADHGKMNYAIGTDDATVPENGWSTKIPTAVDAGTYYVWYKAVGTGGYVDSDATCIVVKVREKISYKVTFKVENGSWNDGAKKDKTVVVKGYEGDSLKLTETQIPMVGEKPGKIYKAGNWNVIPTVETEITEDMVFTYTYVQREKISAQVTFRVSNGLWNDGESWDKVVVVEGLEGDVLKLTADDIPKAGNNPLFGYKAGSWDVTPQAGDEVIPYKVYTYTYVPKEPIRATVTFKVENGKWDDWSTNDRSYTLTGLEGDELRLADYLIPSAGSLPDDTFKKGSWDVVPDVNMVITKDTTFTYKYAKKDVITTKVTFKVVNGSWDNGSDKDVVVTLKGLEGDILSLTYDQIPTAGMMPGLLYKEGSWDVEPVAYDQISQDVTYTYTYQHREPIAVNLIFKVENGSWDDGTTDDIKITLNGYEGDSLKLDRDQIPTVGTKPADGYKEGDWDVTPSDRSVMTRDKVYTYTYAMQDKPHPDGEEGVVIVPEEKQKDNYAGGEIDLSVIEVRNLLVTDEDLIEIEDGKDVSIWVEMQNSIETVSAQDKALVEEKVNTVLGSDYVVGTYLDITLWKQISGYKAYAVSKVPNGKVKISMHIPEELRKFGRRYKMAYMHDGMVDIIDTVYDAETFRLIFETDHFSTFALVYCESESVTKIFKDIDPKAWYVEAAQFVYDTQIMYGKGEKFEPNAVITREEVIQTIYNFMGKPRTGSSNPFWDVKDGGWYYDAVVWGNENKIVAGYGDGVFGVGDTVTREQLAQMLYNFAVFRGYDLTSTKDASKGYSDSNKIDTWATDAMDWAISQGIMSGKGEQDAPKKKMKLDPLAGATRAECASMIMKIVQKNTK